MGLFLLMMLGAGPMKAQSLPEVFENGSVQEQFEYLHQRAGIYNNYRAIREDMFQKIRKNTLDSLQKSQGALTEATRLKQLQEAETQNLKTQITQLSLERDQAIKERDSLFLLGLPINKTLYNTILWATILGLVVLMGFLGILFKRANGIARQKSTDLLELREEFEQYRKTARERYEKQSIEHFNELKKLKGL